MDNQALYKISYGLFVLSAHDEGKDNGCIINTAIQAASAPNQLSISVNKGNYTHEMIMKTGKFNVSVISQNATFDLFKRFGFQSGRDNDKLADFKGYDKAENGIIYITEGTNAYFSVEVNSTVDLGSHTMFIGQVTDMKLLNDNPSATYDYYHSNIKQVNKSSKAVYRCRICGYEYEGEALPEDFICPICKHPASDFEKI